MKKRIYKIFKVNEEERSLKKIKKDIKNEKRPFKYRGFGGHLC